MRTQFHDSLDQLATLLRLMCRHDLTAIDAATDAVLRADVGSAESVIDTAAIVATLGEECENTAVSLLALQAPVAGELRQVVTAIQLGGELTRMAALAEHIALTARRRHPKHAVPESVRPIVARMGSAAVGIVRGALEVLDTRDPHKAAALTELDDVMNGVHRELLTAILSNDWAESTTAVVDLTLLGRYYERFADRAAEVGRRTIFMTTGQNPDTWIPDQGA
ncbi:phosphate signaling complex protein PhoU [Nocardia arizonensis]|uniref:phosphate signaling complex protein PhoU n=1 Tax=Nocardia arizonensis TaxID=1141647 RepID=UPI0006D06D61|nr:phosphate signaling complex protein PhoU [Nocardia arizonensis]